MKLHLHQSKKRSELTQQSCVGKLTMPFGSK